MFLIFVIKVNTLFVKLAPIELDVPNTLSELNTIQWL